MKKPILFTATSISAAALLALSPSPAMAQDTCGLNVCANQVRLRRPG